ncbi:MAG TPA: hypothetical protein VIL86_03480 [Tepidisphaeraceae bacterium]
MALNHYAINQIVGGKMVAGKRPRFGHFGLLNIVGDMLKNRPRPNANVPFDLSSDRIVYDAFLRISNGTSAETVLLDKSLASKFHSESRKLGFHASAADMNRRLINIRKNPARYEKHGIVLPEATKVTPHPSIVPQYAHIIEFALARLRLRYGVTIDDILIDPELTAQYEEMVSSAAPSLTSEQVRLAALYIRKTRYIAKKNLQLVASLNVQKMESAFTDLGSVSRIDPSAVRDDEGIVEILENGRHLYISRNENLRLAVNQIGSPSSLMFMANDFWKPNPENLSVRIFEGEKFLKIPVSQWQLKLISERKPVFNYPVAA